MLPRSTSPSPSPDTMSEPFADVGVHDLRRVLHLEDRDRRRVGVAGGQRELRSRRSSGSATAGPRLAPYVDGAARPVGIVGCVRKQPHRDRRGRGRSGRSAGRRGRRIDPRSASRATGAIATGRAPRPAAGGRTRRAGRPTRPSPRHELADDVGAVHEARRDRVDWSPHRYGGEVGPGNLQDAGVVRLRVERGDRIGPVLRDVLVAQLGSWCRSAGPAARAGSRSRARSPAPRARARAPGPARRPRPRPRRSRRRRAAPRSRARPAAPRGACCATRARSSTSRRTT